MSNFTMVLSFVNHSPIRISNPVEESYYDDFERCVCIWSSRQDFGHHQLWKYTTLKGRDIYFITQNSGCSYNGREPQTTNTYLRDINSIKNYFNNLEMMDIYHSKIESKVDVDSILNVDEI